MTRRRPRTSVALFGWIPDGAHIERSEHSHSVARRGNNHTRRFRCLSCGEEPRAGIAEDGEARAKFYESITYIGPREES